MPEGGFSTGNFTWPKYPLPELDAYALEGEFKSALIALLRRFGFKSALIAP